MQYHWIVQYDQDTHRFEIDWDSTQIILNEDSGVVFDKTTQEWHSLAVGDEIQNQLYDGYSEYLALALSKIDTMIEVPNE